jgi:hypothetical protein
MTVSVILTTLYGRSVPSYSSSECRSVEQGARVWNQFLSHNTIRPVDFFPSLRNWPDWMPWNRTIDTIKKFRYGVYETFFNDFEAAVDTGRIEAARCFMNAIRSQKAELGFETNDDLMYVTIFWQRLWCVLTYFKLAWWLAHRRRI